MSDLVHYVETMQAYVNEIRVTRENANCLRYVRFNSNYW